MLCEKLLDAGPENFEHMNRESNGTHLGKETDEES